MLLKQIEFLLSSLPKFQCIFEMKAFFLILDFLLVLPISSPLIIAGHKFFYQNNSFKETFTMIYKKTYLPTENFQVAYPLEPFPMWFPPRIH